MKTMDVIVRNQLEIDGIQKAVKDMLVVMSDLQAQINDIHLFLRILIYFAGLGTATFAGIKLYGCIKGMIKRFWKFNIC
ncbi:hypothetical protein PV797_06820 [Clostridiaceae bacterium M8S5]|nr:hypothetical protein PV797_13360 [Clostridiaceae bacterium M8S5]WDV47381.1 hypothetical protein PV797_06820 [Clostridiaceae bacterium M8S5]